MYLGSWKIDDYLTFYANTHDPDTGVATDADSVPTFRVYEDETATPILTGSMALLDSANTAGFYSEQIQLTAANGFEKGKCYAIYITATVDSDEGTMHHVFQIEAEVDANTISDGQISTIDTVVDAIKAVTDNLPNSGALTDLATATALVAVDTVVDAIKAVTDNLPNSGALTDLATAVAVAAVAADLAALNDLSAAEVNAQVDAAIETYHLDHLLAADYDPASKPGVATALFNELVEDDGGVSRFTQNALEQAPGGSGPSAADIADAILDEPLADHDTEDTLGNVLNDLVEEADGTYRFTADALQSTLGSGAIAFTYTLTSSVDASPIDGATVWVTSDQAGNNVLASGTTDSNGQITFYLDAGTVYVWRQKSGWNFTNPDTETIV